MGSTSEVGPNPLCLSIFPWASQPVFLGRGFDRDSLEKLVPPDWIEQSTPSLPMTCQTTTSPYEIMWFRYQEPLLFLAISA